MLCRLFRLILKTSVYPKCWKHALVQPIPKKGDHSNPSNYRPIALTSAIAKVFEFMLNSHFLEHLESHSLISDHQYGFRKARSTGDLLSYLTDIWSSSLRDFGESFVVALDISKAFDRVWHKALLAKLPSYGFTPSLTKLIASFLSSRSIAVVADGATSASFPVSSGVPQGSVLSPTLFLLFINDLLCSPTSPIHSYADDSTLHKSSSFSSQPSAAARLLSRNTISTTINSDLERISDWGSNNLVRFNSAKTQLLPISLSNDPSDFDVIFEGNIVNPLHSINILGVEISSNLSWRSHIVQIAKSAS
ncbi:MAG: reverse transcriptase family protein, partial [Bacteroidota bacterium]